MSAEVLNKSAQGNQAKKVGSDNKFHLGTEERKLPRPIVFWSDNERDAFRRNKIVQTRFFILLDDIETQKRFSKRSIRYEAHKFRQQSAKYLRNSSKFASDASSMCGSDLTFVKNKSHVDNENMSEISSIAEDNEDESFWDKNSKAGVVTKSRKATVKFSVYKEFIPNDIVKNSDEPQATSTSISSKIRSMSANHVRHIPELPVLPSNERSKSVIPTEIKRLSSASSQRKGINNNFIRKCSTPTERNDTNNCNKAMSQNKMYFDRSQAAFQLRKELQRLARLRKQGIVTSSFSVVNALKEEKQKYDESRNKVDEYLRKLDLDKLNASSDQN